MPTYLTLLRYIQFDHEVAITSARTCIISHTSGLPMPPTFSSSYGKLLFLSTMLFHAIYIIFQSTNPQARRKQKQQSGGLAPNQPHNFPLLPLQPLNSSTSSMKQEAALPLHPSSPNACDLHRSILICLQSMTHTEFRISQNQVDPQSSPPPLSTGVF